MQTIVVFGPQRSGTSLISRLLAEAGVPIGDLYNKIVYEDQLAYDINNCILAQMGCSFKKPPTDGQLTAFKSLDVLCQFYVWKRNFHPVWAFKVPTTTLLLDYYAPYLRNPVFIATDRDIEESRLSIAKQNHLKYEQTAYIAEYHRRRDEFLNKTKHPWIKVNFHDLIVKPEQTVKKISKFTGIKLDPSIIDPFKPEFHVTNAK